MDFGGKKDVPNPREGASLLSRLFFLWIFPLLRQGSKNDLGIDDIYNAQKEDESSELGTRLGQAWDEQLVGSKAEAKNEVTKQPKFYKALWSVFGAKYSLLCFGTLVDECVIRVAQPIFLRMLIKSFSDHGVTSSQQLVYASGVCFTSLAHALLMHPVSFGILHLGMKCRVATSSLIYRKTLKLSKAAQEETPIGQLINLLSSDVNRFDFNVLFCVIGPLQTIIFTYILWEELGISCLAGTGFVMILMPMQWYIGKLSRVFRSSLASKSDERGRIMGEIITAMRTIKIYAWERPFASLVKNIRKEEVQALRKRAYLRSFYFSMFVTSSKLVPYMTFFLYVMLGNQLTADKVFFALTVFNVVIQNMVSVLPSAAAMIGEVTVALNRIEQFLLLDEQKMAKNVEVRLMQSQKELLKRTTVSSRITPAIQMENVSAHWNGSNSNSLDQVTTSFSGHKLIMVVGPIGGGKSSFLQALLQELPISTGKCMIKGHISYATQEPWIFSGTLRQNILFGLPYEEDKYQEVISACALANDFAQLPQGDETQMGEKGGSLSGGQKARLGLARGLYQHADIYLMDDPLSAVDAKVSRHIFDRCMKRYLVNNLRILVTHQLQYLPQADYILVFEQGKLVAQGTYKQLEERRIDFLKIISNETEESKLFRRASSIKIEQAEKVVEKDVERRKTLVETMEYGSISLKTYWDYFRLGNSYVGMFSLLIAFIVSQLLYSFTDYWLSFWTSSEVSWSTSIKTTPEEDLQDASSIFKNWGLPYKEKSADNNLIPEETMFTTTPAPPSRNIFSKFLDGYRGQEFYIWVYTCFVISVAIATHIKAAGFFTYCLRISVNIHEKMFSGLIRAPVKFFDDNPSGRIMNRFSKDLSSMDENLPAAFIDVIEIGLVMIGVIIIVVLSNFYVIVPSIMLILSLGFIRKFYIKTARDIKRLEAITKSPLFTHLTASVQGLSTIRASKRQAILIDQFDSIQDIHSATWFLFISSNRWFGIWLDMVSVLFLASVTYGFLIFAGGNSGTVGLAVSSVLTLTGTFQWGMRQSAETENLMTSVERTIEYTKIEPEEDPNEPPPPAPDNWPKGGQIEFKELSLAYGTKKVLDNLNFVIKPGEKIGIVGRTGAGKSTILNALFRLSETTGEVLIDGVETSQLGLHELRKNLSIIPQEPVLFSGSLRANLDPFERFSDDELWDVLEEVDLRHVVHALDWQVHDGGSNFSQGQRQLISLGRAILRRNKVIVMDEATANMDPQTDAFIQETIKKKFGECTVLMIAHRLHSVVECDKVLVLETGRLKEFDHAWKLYQNKGIFHSMSRSTGGATHEQLMAAAKNAYLKKFGSLDQDSIANDENSDAATLLT
ncbi:Multidrug resistance-associated protein 4 [Orchesella cincta]|uniref:Multidrug resistance-associated protein 4 n=1 Tax=Orchesella cincta TaxID=48709 RepID=A0A1D2N109_ORCCI|nr:Multidrug resistance-associated protein 4 [Orchesella cincta]